MTAALHYLLPIAALYVLAVGGLIGVILLAGRRDQRRRDALRPPCQVIQLGPVSARRAQQRGRAS